MFDIVFFGDILFFIFVLFSIEFWVCERSWVFDFSSCFKDYFLSDMRLYEVNEDLFRSSLALGHCVSKDFKMGKGVAKKMKFLFGPPSPSLRLLPVGDVGVQNTPHGPIFHLITKRFFYEKPRIDQFEQAIISFRDEILRWGIREVAVPRLGTGLDRIPWGVVKRIILAVFNGYDVDVYVHYI